MTQHSFFKRQLNQTGFGLFEISLALLLAAIVAFFGLRAFIRSADISAGALRAQQLVMVRDAYKNYLDTYRSNFINNQAITTPAASTIPASTSAVSGSGANAVCAPSGSVRCPTIAQLVDLRLLPSGFPSGTIGMCGYSDVDAASTPTATSSPYCGQLENRCTSTTPQTCSIKGFVAYVSPMANANVVQGALDNLNGLGMFSRVPGENLRGAGGAYFAPNTVAGTPANVLGASFAVYTGATNQVANVDFCPGDAAAKFTATSATTADILLSNGTKYANGATFASGSGCNASSSGTFAYGNTPVLSSSIGSGGSAGNPISAIVSCNSVSGAAKPSYTITQCGDLTAGVDYCPSQTFAASTYMPTSMSKTGCYSDQAVIGDVPVNTVGVAQTYSSTGKGNTTGFFTMSCTRQSSGKAAFVYQGPGSC